MLIPHRFLKVLMNSCQIIITKPCYLSSAPLPPRSLSCFPSAYNTRFSVFSGDIPASVTGDTANMHFDRGRSYEVVVAATRDMGIGKDGKLPWRLPTDLKFFKELTMTTSNPGIKNAVLMGRKTWESIPLKYRPLPGRLNVVLTRSSIYDIGDAENVVTCRSVPSALELLAEAPYDFSIEKVFVIGGGQILRETMNAPRCDAIHITEIETNIECDTFIPVIDLAVFHRQHSSEPTVENNIQYSFAKYVRFNGTRNSEDDVLFQRASSLQQS